MQSRMTGMFQRCRHCQLWPRSFAINPSRVPGVAVPERSIFDVTHPAVRILRVRPRLITHSQVRLALALRCCPEEEDGNDASFMRKKASENPMTQTVRALFPILLLVVATGGCAKEGPPPQQPTPAPVATTKPTCQSMAAHFGVLLREAPEAAKASAEVRQQNEAKIGAMVDGIASGCKDSAWSDQALACAEAAKDLKEWRECVPRPK
jgi:hypothetical protein